jgi:hypothetical protein
MMISRDILPGNYGEIHQPDAGGGDYRSLGPDPARDDASLATDTALVVTVVHS